HRHRRLAVRLSLPDQPYRPREPAAAGRTAPALGLRIRPRRIPGGGRHHHADPGGAGPPVAAQPPRSAGRRAQRRHSTRQGDPVMEAVLSLAIGIVFGAGIWLVLRPRSFQVLAGLMLMSYAVNLFIFAMGRLAVDRPPFTPTGTIPDPSALADPVPQPL